MFFCYVFGLNYVVWLFSSIRLQVRLGISIFCVGSILEFSGSWLFMFYVFCIEGLLVLVVIRGYFEGVQIGCRVGQGKLKQNLGKGFIYWKFVFFREFFFFWSVMISCSFVYRDERASEVEVDLDGFFLCQFQ